MFVQRKKEGATLAFVVSLIFLVIMIGVGFFLWIKLMGGGAELQHATDSGNLNVVVKVLKQPSITLTNANEIKEFGNLCDPGNKVNLLNFNKLVAKVALAEANAAAEDKQAHDHGQPGAPVAIANAKALVNMLEGPGGIASRLAAELNNHDNLKDFFNALSKSNSTRMLNETNTKVDQRSETDVAYFADGKATNVFLDDQSIPSNVRDEFFTKNTTSSASGGARHYLKGYSKFEMDNFPFTAGDAWAWGVPMRPGEQPHLVGTDEFARKSTTPGGVAGSGLRTALVPNAFKSGATDTFMGNLVMRSAAVVGTLNAEYRASIPDGYIRVDNTGELLSFNGNFDDVRVWQEKLMLPHEVEIMIIHDENGNDWRYIADDDHRNHFENLIQQARDSFHSGPGLPHYDPFADPTLATDVDDPGVGPDDDWRFHSLGVSPTYRSQWPGRVFPKQPVSAPNSPGVEIHKCNNVNSVPGPSADPVCLANIDHILSVYHDTSGGHREFGDLMAIEKFAADVIAGNGPSTSTGCAIVYAPGANQCSALKQYDHTPSPPYSNVPFRPDKDANVFNNLLNQVGDTNNPPIKQQITERLRQMKPGVEQAKIDAVFNSNIHFHKKMYIYWDEGSNGFLVTETKPPFAPDADTAPPDGQPFYAQNAAFNVLYSHVDVPSSRWEAPPPVNQSQDKAEWYPSSGHNHNLGVLQFRNCALGGGEWCSP